MAKIVIMEDEPSTREAMRRMLERASHEVEAFEDAGPALESVDFSTVDLVIVDLQMPTSGYDAIEKIRGEGLNDLPIIVVSAYVDLELTADILNVQEILRKPFEAEEVLKSVKRLL